METAQAGEIFSGKSMLRLSLRAAMLTTLLLPGGCSTVGKITNTPVQHLPAAEQRYSFANHVQHHPIGNVLLILAFSGGGTRAAALSYGVLEELKNTSYEAGGQQYRLLDEVDRISSVSGGSFTAAYYGLFGEQIFAEFKDGFLYKDIEGGLTDRIFGVFNLVGRQFSSVSRTEDAIHYYDEHIFKGKTFADLQRSSKPFILINATDLNSQKQFTFSQRQFDFFCSDLSEFSVARAVAASSAVPIIFHPILIKKHQDCNFAKPVWLAKTEQRALQSENMRLQELVRGMEFYLDEANPPFATLLDGGVTDNLGLRAILRNIMLSGGAERLFTSSSETDSIEHVVIVVVNASTTADTDIGKSQTLPTTFDVFSAVTDIQLHLYNIESNSVVKNDLMQLARSMSRRDEPIEPYFIELSIDDLENPEEREYLNTIPTSFYLEREQADRIVMAAKRLLRQDPGYQRLLENLGARVPAGGI